MNEAYAAWDLDIDTLSTPHDFVKAGVLAPSSHNSQPWAFTWRDANTLLISLNESRRLKESDVNDRQAIISIGCALTNIELVADYHGYAMTVQEDPEALVRVHFSKTASSQVSETMHLAHSITKRVTNRSPHTPHPKDTQVIRAIQALSPQGVRVDVVTDRMLVRELGTIAVDAAIHALDDPGFRSELSQYLNTNSTKSPVGMPGFGFGFPTPMALVAPTLIRFFNLERPIRNQNIGLFEKTTALVLLSTKNDTPTDWMNVGRTYEHVSLLAVSYGATTAPWAAAVQIGDFHMEIEKRMQLPGRLQFFARLGFPTLPTPHSPRLEAKHVTI